jgi:hypothetical protein
MAVSLQVDLEGAEEFAQALAQAIQKNPNMMQTVLRRAMDQFARMGPEAALNGGRGLRRVTGKTYQAGFKQYRRPTKRYARGIFSARIANIFQGKKKGSNLPNIPIMRLAERAFRRSGLLEKITREEMERVYDGNY